MSATPDNIPRVSLPPEQPIGAWGHRTEYGLLGEVLYVPLVWYRGGAGNTIFARSEILDAEGFPLEWWIELKGSKAQLSADVELMQGKTEIRRDVGECVYAANLLERVARGQLRLKAQPALPNPATPTPTAGQSAKGAP